MMLAARGAIRASGAGLPYDAEVEYLESSGTQYIDTGIVPTTTKTEITFSTPTPPSSGYMCGSFNANDNRYYPAAFSGSSTRYINLINAANTVISQYTNDGNVHTVVYNATGGACYFDGVAAGTLDTTTLTASNPIYLFCTSTSTGASGLVSGRIYSCKLYDANGTLVRDYIPVRKGTVGYLYDRVSGKLFGNAGTGAFSYGSDVVLVEWLQTDGAAYIDTGLEMADGHEVQGEHYFKRSTTRQLMGSNASRQYYGVSADGYVEFGLLGTNKSTVSVDEAKKYLISYAASGGNNTGSIYEGDTLLWSSSGAYYGFSNSFKIFRLSTNARLSFVAGNKIASFKHIASGETIQSLRSARVGTDATSWEGAMMDVLTRRIYRNAGTGAFIYGNDLKYPIPA